MRTDEKLVAGFDGQTVPQIAQSPATPAVHALLKLHAELGGHFQQNRKEATKLRAA